MLAFASSPALASAGSLGVQMLAMLAAAALVATVFLRFRLEFIPGYLLAGAIIGPNALRLVRDADAVQSIADLAVILLMFTIGMHLDISAIRRGMVHILAVGAVTTLATAALAFGGAIPLVSWHEAVVIAMALALSSTAVVVRVIASRREARSSYARLSLGISIVQDLASVVFMAIIPPLARLCAPSPIEAPQPATTLPTWLQVVSAGALGLGGITVMLLAGRVLLPRALHAVARLGSSELVLVVSAVCALGAAIMTAGLGFSPEMGAFLAGFLLAGTPFRYQLAGQLTPIRDLLMAVFFTAVGMRVDPGVVVQHLPLILGGAAVLVAGKAAVIGLCAWGAGASGPGSLIAGVYLANAGEFSLVVLGAAAASGVLGATPAGVVIAIVILSLVVSPLLVAPAHVWSGRLAWVKPPRWARRSVLADAPDVTGGAGAPHVVIAGFGPVGRTLADRLGVLGIAFTVVELNPGTVERQTNLGRRIVYGDATNPDVLIEAGVPSADAVLLTFPDDETTLRATRAARSLAPGAFIAARTGYLSGKIAALQLGADHVTVEEIATARAMEKELLPRLRGLVPQAPEAHAVGGAGSDGAPRGE